MHNTEVCGQPDFAGAIRCVDGDYIDISFLSCPIYQVGLSDRQLGTFCSLIFQIKVIPEIQNAYLFSYIGVSLSLFLYLFCPF